MKTINIGKEFSHHPAGRYYSDGPFSGQFFREKYLWPDLEKNQSVTIELDDAEGYGSSFLEEAFGGLIRLELMTHEQLLSRIAFVTEDEALLEEVLAYVHEAVPGELGPPS